MASQISQAIKQICDEKNISYESVIETIGSALAAAYRKDFGNKNQNIQVEFDPEKYDGMTQGIRVFDVKEVVEDMELPEPGDEESEKSNKAPAGTPLASDSAARATRRVAQQEKAPVGAGSPRPPEQESAEGTAVATAGTEGEAEDEEPKFNPKTMIMIRDARDIKPDAKIGEEIRVELSIPDAFGRMAAQTAKQVIMQKLREAERNVIFEDFKGREGELMNVTVQRREGRIVLIDLGRATGILLPEDQIEIERYYPGTRIKALLREVVMTPKGPEIRLSRSHQDLVAALFAQEIPEIANGIVVIKAIAREAGSRTKVAVTTNDDAIDPIGSCIGQRGTRIQSVIRELGGEKVDVILWSDDPATFIAAALSPATVSGVQINEDEHLASVSVGADQLSLAIGKGGQNVRLAAKLTNWRITIIKDGGEAVADSESGEFASPEEEIPLDEHGEHAERAAEADANEPAPASKPEPEPEPEAKDAASATAGAEEAAQPSVGHAAGEKAPPKKKSRSSRSKAKK
jgi:N utilization substance protein A